MATTPTRTLVLGVVRLFSPANGYQLRRELVSWHVDEWAKVNPGSIYSMLTTLTKQGMIEAHVLPDGARSVTVYTMAEAGFEELDRLIREGIRAVTPMDPTGFRVALSFSTLLERADFVALMEERLATVKGGADGLRSEAERVLETGFAPPHVGYSLGLEGRILETEAGWIQDMIDLVRGGGMAFAGEPMDWAPPAEDEGWQMAQESARYREQLDRMHERIAKPAS